MSRDELAEKLARLQLRRDRTLDELETITLAARSLKNSMEKFPEKHAAINNDFIDRLSDDDLDEPTRMKVYREWGDALKVSTENFNRLAEERDRLAVQEMLLRHMSVEISQQISDIEQELTSERSGDSGTG